MREIQSSAKRKLSPAQERNVYKKARKRMNARKISEELSGEDVSYSESSVRNDLNKRRFSISISKRIRRISEAQKKRGMALLQRYAEYKYRPVLFTDENSFWLGSPSNPCWQQLDDRVIEEYAQIYAWDGVSSIHRLDAHLASTEFAAPWHEN